MPFDEQLGLDAGNTWTAAHHFLACGAHVEKLRKACFPDTMFPASAGQSVAQGQIWVGPSAWPCLATVAALSLDSSESIGIKSPVAMPI
jgi:hypothetical protein